jgi:uncharacterized membrane protein HdeD (DUF308 family)
MDREREVSKMIGVAVLARNWWIMLLRGLLAIAFGIAALVIPGAVALALVIVFGAWAFVDGIFALGAAFGPNTQHRWMLVLEGIVGVLAGLVAWFYPALFGLTIVLFIAWWAIITGVLEVIYAIQLRKELENDWLYILAGVASVVFGGLILWRPGAGALAVLWIIATYALVFGVLLIGFSLRLRSFATSHPVTTTT